MARGYQYIGKTNYVIAANVNHVGVDATCLIHDKPFRLGTANYAMCIGKELLGYICLDCLNDHGRAQVREFESRWLVRVESQTKVTK